MKLSAAACPAACDRGAGAAVATLDAMPGCPPDEDHLRRDSGGRRWTMTDNANLFTALRRPSARSGRDRDRGCRQRRPVHTWRDLERGTAMIANLLGSLDLLAGHPRRGADRQVGRGADALTSAVLRAGCVYLPLNNALPGRRDRVFPRRRRTRRLRLRPQAFGALSKLAFRAGVTHVFSLGADRSGTLLDSRRAARRPPRASAPRRRRPGGDPLHQSGRPGAARARC